MNITYLIGNGFDLGLGLKTRFSDFLPIYISKKSKDEDILDFQDDIAKSINDWSDYELKLGQHTEKYNEGEIVKFLSQKEHFDNEFMKYLTKEQNKITIEDEDLNWFVKNLYWHNNTEKPLLRDVPLKIIRKRFGEQEINKFNFINFNYTNCLEKILDDIKQKKELNKRLNRRYATSIYDRIEDIVYVHGKIGKSPNIGVNDKTQIKNEKFANTPYLTEMLIKHDFDIATEYGFESQAQGIIDDSDIICIYGMSLGATDKQWWEYIIDWLNAAMNRYLVVFVYDENYIESDRRFRDRKADIRRILFNNTLKHIPSDRVFCIIHRNIFQRDLVHDEGVEKEIASTEVPIKNMHFIRGN